VIYVHARPANHILQQMISVKLALALFQAQAAVPPPSVDIPRIEASVVVDGALDEPVWSRAAVLTDFRQYEPVDGRPAEERTEVLVWYAPDAIHFGIRAYDSQPQSIRATRADRDNIGSEDHVLIYLDTFNDRRRAFFFGANAIGVQTDGVRTEGAATAGRMFGGSVDDSPDYVFESAGRITSEGYVLEIRIPFRSLRFPGGGAQEWGLQIERKVQRTGYTDTWTDVRRASASFLRQAGTITGLHDLERGMVFEAQPFLTSAINGARNQATGRFDREDPDTEVGANLRFGFSSISLDATINPDFSQVEADASQVTVNERFALFFEEKRPFFLEGIELFATPNQLVYTRRIAQPIAGGKVTGKVGPLGIAHLTAVDEGLNGGSDALFNVTRVRTDLGANSSAGLVFTDRTELDGDVYNRVAAADLRHVFGRMYYLELQGGGAWTHDAPGTAKASPIWRAEVDRTGRSWGFNYSLNGVADDFRTDAGFVNRTGVVSGRAFNRLTWYGERGSLVETVSTIIRPSRIWRYDDFPGSGAIEGDNAVSTTVRLRGGWEIEGVVGSSFVRLDVEDYAGVFRLRDDIMENYQPLERVAGPQLELSVQTPTYQRFEAELEFEHARVAIFPEGSRGINRSVGLDVTLRPVSSIRMFLTGAYEKLSRDRDGSEFARTIIPRALLEYQPTRAFFVRVLGEYRAERRAALQDAFTGEPLWRDAALVGATELNGVRVDLLAAYEPTPGTVAYLGYGATLNDAEAFRFSGMQRSADGVFLKLAYQFRR
jgi:hypothetical protein